MAYREHSFVLIYVMPMFYVILVTFQWCVSYSNIYYEHASSQYVTM